jgi:hypothetical protein
MKKKGAALLVVIIIMMLTFMLAAIMFETSVKHIRVSNDTLESTKAYYCAESGVYDAINYIELMAEAGSFNRSYFGQSIPISNLYSKDENGGYLFGDSSASYTASIELMEPIQNDEETKVVDEENVTFSTPLTDKKYRCEVNSKGSYNNQNHLINDTVEIFYNEGSWTYRYISKLSIKE